jgi:hypothetical protein
MGLGLTDQTIVTKGKEVPVDQVDPARFEKFLKSGKIKELVVRKEAVKKEPTPDQGKAGKKGGK